MVLILWMKDAVGWQTACCLRAEAGHSGRTADRRLLASHWRILPWIPHWSRIKLQLCLNSQWSMNNVYFKMKEATVMFMPTSLNELKKTVANNFKENSYWPVWLLTKSAACFFGKGAKKEREKSANHFNEKLHIIADVEINVLVLTYVAYNANTGAVGTIYCHITGMPSRSFIFQMVWKYIAKLANPFNEDHEWFSVKWKSILYTWT